MDYLSLLKEAVTPTAKKNQPPIIKETIPRKLDKNLQVDFKRLWEEMVKDDDKYSTKYKEEPISKNKMMYNWIRLQRTLVYIKDDSLLGFIIIQRVKDTGGRKIEISSFVS